MHPTIVIAVRTLGINIVNPWAPLANPFAAVPNATAIENGAVDEGAPAIR